LLDNCPRETHIAIAAVIKAPGNPLSLLTVDLDIRDDKPEDTDVFRLQGASEAVMESLLAQRYPALPQAIRRRIAEFSGGNARITLLAARVAVTIYVLEHGLDSNEYTVPVIPETPAYSA
jgi:hypothetical protein